MHYLTELDKRLIANISFCSNVIYSVVKWLCYAMLCRYSSEWLASSSQDCTSAVTSFRQHNADTDNPASCVV